MILQLPPTDKDRTERRVKLETSGPVGTIWRREGWQPSSPWAIIIRGAGAEGLPVLACLATQLIERFE